MAIASFLSLLRSQQRMPSASFIFFHVNSLGSSSSSSTYRELYREEVNDWIYLSFSLKNQPSLDTVVLEQKITESTFFCGVHASNKNVIQDLIICHVRFIFVFVYWFDFLRKAVVNNTTSRNSFFLSSFCAYVTPKSKDYFPFNYCFFVLFLCRFTLFLHIFLRRVFLN